MYSFWISIALLIIGYIFYGRFIEKNFEPDDRPTPAVKINDGVDFIPMPTWKVFLIQLLNIAGTGPIFGALSGAVFGPIVYIWIVFGCIFAGAVHDYSIGMLSVRHSGASVSELVGIYLGKIMKFVMRVFSVILLVMCGVVFTTGPADLLGMITPEFFTHNVWLIIILVYYFFATFVPIDRIIGKIYPLFGVCMIVMAVGVARGILFSGDFVMPEVWENFTNMHAGGVSVWPFMFITVACGAISGFHATQSPMMARCINSEKEGRKVFYGAMVAEGIIALIWAAAGVSVYEDSRALLEAGGGCSAVVYQICNSTMGKIGMILAMIGVVICPITSGDTAYRSARLTLADWLGIDQTKAKNRLYLTLPLLAVGGLICLVDYSVVWRYFSWANQTLAALSLWTITVYLGRNNKKYHATMLPAAFMTVVTTSYFISAPECLGMIWNRMGIPYEIYHAVGTFISLLIALPIPAVYRYIIYKKANRS